MASNAPGASACGEGLNTEIHYRLLFENSMDGILLTSPDGRIFDANPSACRIFQRTREEIIAAGRAGLMDISDPNLGPVLEERKRTGVGRAELRALLPDGSVFPVEVSSAIFENAAGEQFTCTILRDISARKRAEVERERLIRQREEALEQVKILRGLLPVCAWCRKIRDEGNQWLLLEDYVRNHSSAKFTHSICPSCRKQFEESF